MMLSKKGSETVYFCKIVKKRPEVVQIIRCKLVVISANYFLKSKHKKKKIIIATNQEFKRETGKKNEVILVNYI